MTGETIREIRAALGPGRTSQAPPVEELWIRIAARMSLQPRRRRRSLEWGMAATLIAAAVLLVVIVRRNAGDSVPSARVATNASLESIDAALAKLRKDSSSVARVAEEMLFLARMRASLQSDFPERSVR